MYPRLVTLRMDNKLIRVKFTGGREAAGISKGYDPLLNIVLDNSLLLNTLEVRAQFITIENLIKINVNLSQQILKIPSNCQETQYNLVWERLSSSSAR